MLALEWSDAVVVLLEGSTRRGEFLLEAVRSLDLARRVTVAVGRAEDLARDPQHEGRYDLVTARAFGPPSATAECAARLLVLGGTLVVSEPPTPGTSGRRWPEGGLAILGLGPARAIEAPPRLVSITKVGPCPDPYPRRVGVPVKRPLF